MVLIQYVGVWILSCVVTNWVNFLMKTLLVKRAFESYKNGQFEESLVLYEEAASLYGFQLFRANILICKKEIENQKNKINSKIEGNNVVFYEKNTDRMQYMYIICISLFAIPGRAVSL